MAVEPVLGEPVSPRENTPFGSCAERLFSFLMRLGGSRRGRIMRAIATSILCVLALADGARAASLYERYAGTKIILRTTNTLSNGDAATTSSSFSITERGLAAPGVPTIKDRTIVNIDAHTRISLSASGDTFTIETTQPTSKFWNITKITLNGDTCTASAKSSHYKSVVACSIASRGSGKSVAKDDPRACKVVQEAIAEIRSLTPTVKNRDTYKAAVGCDRMNKITRSIKGAGCPSLFPKVDAALGKAKQSCRKIDHELSEVGVRG